MAGDVNGVAITREAHKRILNLVATEDWGAFNSTDEHLLQSMLVTGHIAFSIGGTQQSRIRLRLTQDGWLYLSNLGD